MKSLRMQQRGVSLIEALVALAVMAFGMMAMVGMQSTLRANSDVAKQRAEAVRIAQAAVEDWRAFEVLAAAAGVVDYADIATQLPVAVNGYVTNTAYTRTPTVEPAAPAASAPKLKTVTMKVEWTDRSGQLLKVSLATSIAGIAPELAGSLGIPGDRSATQRPRGRATAIPPAAQNLGNGTSVFMPPQGPAGTVAWVFNNTTGLITGVCNVAVGSTTDSLVIANVANCSANTTAQLLSGFVAFASVLLLPDAAQAEMPTGGALNLDVVLTLSSALHPQPPVCFDDASADALVAAAPGTRVAYFCAVFSNLAGTWAGRLRIVPVAFNAAPIWSISNIAGAGRYKICRYTTLAADLGPRNIDHPLDYTEAGSAPRASLANQNFLVISASHTCPTDTVAPGDFVNSNTRLHQDGSVAYSN